MAQGLQGLGSGALQNELAARQAQQGMGTVEQQTQQKGTPTAASPTDPAKTAAREGAPVSAQAAPHGNFTN